MAANRNYSATPASAGVAVAIVEAMRPAQHRIPRSPGDWSPLCRRRRRQRNPDASLSAFGELARHFAGPHAALRRGSSTDNGHRRGTAIRGGGSARNHRRNTDCRDHSRNRCVPGPRIAHNCRVGTISGLPACSPRTALDKAARDWHKGEATAPPCACAKEGPGFCQECARAFVYPASAKRIRRERRPIAINQPRNKLTARKAR